MLDGDPFRLAFDAALEFQLLLDERGAVLGVSEGYLQAAGLAREQVLGKRLAQLPPYAGSVTATQLLEESLTRIHRLRIPSSTPIPEPAPCSTGMLFAHASNVPLVDARRGVTYVVHRMDVAAVVPGENEHERRFRKLVEYNFDAIVLSDALGRVTFASPSIERITGFAPGEYLVRPRAADLHPGDAATAADAARSLLSRPGGVSVTRLRRLHRDGTYRTIELTMVNHLHDPDVNSLVLTLHDVTEQVALDEELRRSAEQLQLALSAAAAITWDRDLVLGSVTYSSDYAAFFGLGPGDYHGDTAAAVHPSDRAAVKSHLADAAAGTGDVRTDFRGPDRGRDTRWYSSRGRMVHDENGRVVRQIGVTWDVTEARKMQEERLALAENLRESQKLESLGVLAGGIAHDFNNLLATILGNVSLMIEEAGGHRETAVQLGQVEMAARQAADLCKQMLAYAGKASVVLSNTDLNRLVGEIAHLLRVSISKKVDLRFALRPDLPPIAADTTQMQQVLMNLIINASDAIENEAGEITVRTEVVRADRAYLDQALLTSEIPEGMYVLVEVTDTGRGMPTELQQRIFEPFFSTKGMGRGLGLAAVLGIVRGHGGALRLYSEPGKGTTFKLLFPASAGASVSSSSEERASRPLKSQGAILLVEDEAALRSVARRMITKLGLRVIDATDGRHGVEVFAQHKGDIAGVLMDLTMPHMSGEEALRELVRIDPQVRVLLMSGYSKRDDISATDVPGLVGFVQKPFNLNELRKQLRKLVE